MLSALAEALSSLASPWVLAAFMVVVFAAYALRGATGFGAGVVAIPLLALALPLNVVIPVVTTLGIVASLGQSIQEFRHVDWRALRGLALPSAIGLGVGLWLFASLDRGKTWQFKPNLPVMFDQMNPGASSPQRQAAFSLFYMSVQVSALLWPLVTGLLGERVN